jgi:hypothetical protein
LFPEPLFNRAADWRAAGEHAVPLPWTSGHALAPDSSVVADSPRVKGIIAVMHVGAADTACDCDPLIFVAHPG